MLEGIRSRQQSVASGGKLTLPPRPLDRGSVRQWPQAHALSIYLFTLGLRAPLAEASKSKCPLVAEALLALRTPSPGL